MTKAKQSQGQMQGRGLVFLSMGILTSLVGVVFLPVLGFDFIDYDVPGQVLENVHIRGLTLENLKHIFTSRCVDSYYPIRTWTYALDYQLWGLEPGGFKLTNVLLHLTNVLLVFWLVLRLHWLVERAGRSLGRAGEIGVATFSASIFGLHPVTVESVAWVGGREELLMTLGALGCIHFHLAARRIRECGHGVNKALACHAGEVFCCAAACLSNAVGAVIPLLIVAFDLLTVARPKFGRILFSALPLWLIGAAVIVVKKLGSDGELLAKEVALFSADRLMLTFNVYWLNLKTLAWPTHLALQYPPVTHHSSIDVEVLLGALAIGLTCIILWLLRRQKSVVFGLVWFGLALGPTSQIMPHHIHRADRFLYLPLVGLAIATAMGGGKLGNLLLSNKPASRKGGKKLPHRPRELPREIPRGHSLAAAIAAVGVSCLLGVLSWGQVQTWQNCRSVWENCLRIAPGNPSAHAGVADSLAAAGQFGHAMQHYAEAIRVEPDDLDVLLSLALLMATCPDENFRDYDTALRLAEHARGVTDPPEPSALMAIAEIHAQAGRFEASVDAVEEAAALVQAKGDSTLAQDLRQRLQVFKARNTDNP